MRALLIAALVVAPTAAVSQELAIDAFGSLFPADGSSNVDQSIGQKGIFVTFISSGGGVYVAGDPALPLQLGGASVQVSIGGAPAIACTLGDMSPAVGACGFDAADGPFANGVIESTEIRLGDILPLNTDVAITLSGFLSNLPGDTPFSLANWDFTTRVTPVLRDPLLVELVLDVSGSMNRPAVPGAPAGAPRRREAMRTGVPALFDLLGQYGLNDDRVGTVYFDTNATAFDTGVPDKTVSVLAGASDAMRDDILSTLDAPTNGSTSLGGGLDTALSAGFDTIAPAPVGPVNRVVILMSDGEQNRAPLASVMGGPLLVGGVPYPTDIVVHPITAGRMVAAGAALQSSIATATGGNAPLHVEDTADSIPEADFQTYFVQTLAEELVGDKVEMVLDETGKLASGDTAEFVIPATSDEVALSFFFAASDPTGQIRDMRPIPRLFAPDGTEVELRRFVRFGERQVSAKVPLPALSKAGFLKTAGDWRLLVSGDLPAINYHAMVLLDNTMVATTFALGAPAHVTGWPIRIEATLREAENPIKDADVTAVVRAPLNGLGNVLSDAIVELNDQTGGEPFNRAQAKLGAVLDDPNLAKALRQVNVDRVRLLDNGDLQNGDAVAGDGRYSGLYFDTKVEGQYGFDVTALAKNRNGEPGRRVHSLTTHVRPAPDLSASVFEVLSIEEAGNAARAVISFTLRDRFSNRLGPGYEGAIVLTPDRGKVRRLVDRLDGSYEFILDLPPLPDGGPALTGAPVRFDVSVLGESVFQVAFDKLGDGSADVDKDDRIFGQLCRALISTLEVMTEDAVRRRMATKATDADDAISRDQVERILTRVFEEAIANADDLDRRRMLRRMLRSVIQELRAP